MSKPSSAGSNTSASNKVKIAAPAVDEKIVTLQKKLALAFDIFDAQRNKTCDIREVGSIIRSLGIYPSEEQLHGWLKEMEEEEPTGYVTFEKFEKVVLKLLQDTTLARDDEEKIYRAFKTLDQDSKGFLRPEELKEFMVQFGEKFTDEEFEEMLSSCVDPQEGKIYYEDYVKILAQ